MAYRSVMVGFAREMEGWQGLKPKAGFIEKTDRYLLWSDRIMEVFSREPEVESDYAAFVNAVAEAAHDGVRVFSLLAPTQAEFLDEGYKEMSDSQWDAIVHINALLDKGITSADAYSALQRHIGEYVYFRTDHHWTALGAYYAYESFCSAAGLESFPLDGYNEHRADGFLGYLYNYRPMQSLVDSADTIFYYTLDDPAFELLISETGDPPQYWVFLDGDHGYYNVETQVKNGRTAVVVKDSYANSFVPFLAPHYERIVIIDPRYIEGEMNLKDELAKYADLDLLVLNYIFTAAFKDTVDILKLIL
jgi:hypothetical protein